MYHDVFFLQYETVNQILVGSMKVACTRVTFFKCPDSINGANGLPGFPFKNSKGFAGGADIYVKLRVAF